MVNSRKKLSRKTSAKKKTSTLLLRQGIKSEFTDHLHLLGFKRERVNDTSGLSYFFRRILSARHDLVEVTFDQYHKPQFVIEFGEVPVEGIIDSYGRGVPVNEVRCYQLVENGRLYRSCFLSIGKWFGISSIEGAMFDLEVLANKEIQRSIRLYQQVEDWFQKGIVGRNLIVSKNIHNEAGVAKRAMIAKGIWPPDGWTENDERRLKM